MTQSKIDNMIMDTGQRYSDGEGITIGCFSAIDFIKHYGRVQTGFNISVAFHSYLAAMIGSKWYNYKTKNGYDWPLTQHEFISVCLFHDIAEAFVGDVWRPAKVQEFKDLENKIHKAIMTFIEADIAFYGPAADKAVKIVKHEQELVDACAQFVELVRYLEISPAHPVFSEIAASIAKQLVADNMDIFCANELGLNKHQVAVNLLRGACSAAFLEA